jgi:hypothetical protein
MTTILGTKSLAHTGSEIPTAASTASVRVQGKQLLGSH